MQEEKSFINRQLFFGDFIELSSDNGQFENDRGWSSIPFLFPPFTLNSLEPRFTSTLSS